MCRQDVILIIKENVLRHSLLGKGWNFLQITVAEQSEGRSLSETYSFKYHSYKWNHFSTEWLYTL